MDNDRLDSDRLDIDRLDIDRLNIDRLDIDWGLDNDGQILSATTTDVRCRAVVIA